MKQKLPDANEDRDSLTREGGILMLYDALLTHEEKALRDEVRRFVRDEVPADLLRAVNRDETKFPYEFIA